VTELYLCPTVLCEVELVCDYNGCLAEEVSKQSVGSMVWLLSCKKKERIVK
jgi:hypothetical protein